MTKQAKGVDGEVFVRARACALVVPQDGFSRSRNSMLLKLSA